MASFQDLPLELHGEIQGYILDRRDIAALSRVSRHCYRVYNPILWTRQLDSLAPGPVHWAAGQGDIETIRKVLDFRFHPSHVSIHPEKLHFSLDQQVALLAGINWIKDPPFTWKQWSSDQSTMNSMDTPARLAGWDSEDTDLNGEYANYDEFDCGTWWQPIHLAAKHGKTEMVEFLLDQGVDINAVSRNLCGCDHQQLDNASVCEVPPKWGWTVLHVAICHSRIETAKLLLDRGASIKVFLEPEIDNGLLNPTTAMHSAAAVGEIELLEFLVRNGYQTDVNIPRVDIPGYDVPELDIPGLDIGTPLYHAVWDDRWDDTVPWLLQYGALLEPAEDPMHTELNTGCPSLLSLCLQPDHQALFRLLDLYTALHPDRPALNGYGLLQYIMIESPERSDETKVMMMSRLLAMGVPPDGPSRACIFRALILAAVSLNTPAMQVLLKAGANPGLVSPNGSPALDLVGRAVRHPSCKLLKQAFGLLAEHNASVPSMNSMMVCRQQELQRRPVNRLVPAWTQDMILAMAEVLLESGTDPNGLSGFDSRPFTTALATDNFKLATRILEYGGRPGRNDLDELIYRAVVNLGPSVVRIKFILRLDYRGYGIELPSWHALYVRAEASHEGGNEELATEIWHFMQQNWGCVRPPTRPKRSGPR